MHEGGIIAGFCSIGVYYNNTRLENKVGFLEYWGGGGGGGGGLWQHQCDDLYPIWSKLEYRLPTCIVWLFFNRNEL